ncbi:MAG: hypothetical protein WC323_02040 [Patescibacteria group bacterium]|jgi:cell division protein FtsB
MEEEIKINNEDAQDNNSELENIKFKRKISSLFTFTNLNISLILGFVFICVSYLVVSNQLISRGFAINDVKTKLEELEKSNRDLELTAINLESYSYINEKVAELGMVSIGEVEYIEAASEAVAMR